MNKAHYFVESKWQIDLLRVIGRWYRRQAQALGHGSGRCGSVTFMQRFGSSPNVNPHLHVLLLDGVYVDEEEVRRSYRHSR